MPESDCSRRPKGNRLSFLEQQQTIRKFGRQIDVVSLPLRRQHRVVTTLTHEHKDCRLMTQIEISCRFIK